MKNFILSWTTSFVMEVSVRIRQEVSSVFAPWGRSMSRGVKFVKIRMNVQIQVLGVVPMDAVLIQSEVINVNAMMDSFSIIPDDFV